MSEGVALRIEGPLVDGLLAMLRRLDRRLEPMVTGMQAASPEAAGDPYRGLYVSQAEVEQLLGRPPGEPRFPRNGTTSTESEQDVSSPVPRLPWLKTRFGLSPFDLDVVVLALAPELDLRYERIYAYLQDDVTRRRPTVDLALNLLCASPADQLARRAHFGPAAPLVRAGLLHLIRDPAQVQPPLLSHYLKLDDRLVDWLLGLNDDLALEPAASTPGVPVASGTGGQVGGDAAPDGRPADRPRWPVSLASSPSHTAGTIWCCRLTSSDSFTSSAHGSDIARSCTKTGASGASSPTAAGFTCCLPARPGPARRWRRR